jgi:hypothetical protein
VAGTVTPVVQKEFSVVIGRRYGDDVIKLFFFVDDGEGKYARGLIMGKMFEAGLKFVSKVRILPI